VEKPVIVIMKVDIMAKDDGSEPSPQDATAVLNDFVADMTRHDGELSWRVREISFVSAEAVR